MSVYTIGDAHVDLEAIAYLGPIRQPCGGFNMLVGGCSTTITLGIGTEEENIEAHLNLLSAWKECKSPKVQNECAPTNEEKEEAKSSKAVLLEAMMGSFPNKEDYSSEVDFYRATNTHLCKVINLQNSIISGIGE